MASAASANEQLVVALKQLGRAVDDMSVNISKTASEADAELLARVTRETLAGGLAADGPTIVIAAGQGYCRVTIETPEWRLWSESRGGKVIDHGARIY